MNENHGNLQDFLADIRPFFYGKRLTYVDAGAFDGETFEAVLGSGLGIHEALLFEPNPESFAALERRLERHSARDRVKLVPLALAASSGRLRLRLDRGMSRVIGEEEDRGDGAGTGLASVEVESRALDEFVPDLAGRHISLLKVDVEGFEEEVLEGAKASLESHSVDVIYIEAGMDPDGSQQCYYRRIDDLLTAHGYRLFRIYEQVHEWMTDSPFLRRANLAYMSSTFADKNPYRVTKELFEVKESLASALVARKAAQTELEQTLAFLESSRAELCQERALRFEMQELVREREQLISDARFALEERDSMIDDLNDRCLVLEEQVSEFCDRLEQSAGRSEVLEADRSRLRLSQRELREEIKRRATAFRDMKESWSYRLGRTVAEGFGSPVEIAALPLRVGRLVGQYWKSKTASSATSGDVDRTFDVKREAKPFCVPTSRPPGRKSPQSEARRSPGNVLRRADQIAESGDYDEALRFVRTHGDEKDRCAARLLEANRDLESDECWLEHVNAYLSEFGSSKLRLSQGSEPRFMRLRSSPARRVEVGDLVSVIMAAHDSADTIEHAARSILDQSWRPLELIVVDDASKDGTLEVIRKLASEDPRIKVLENSTNVGPYASKNRALRLAKGRFVTGQDADDWSHPERIEQHVGRMLADPQVKVSLGYMLRVDMDGAFTRFAIRGKTSPDGARRLASISCVFDRETLVRVFGHWDCVRFGADSELIERCRAVLGESFSTFDILTMVCLDAPGSLTNDLVHGVSKETGVSAARRYYREQWQAWHKGLHTGNCYLGFPPAARPFDAPPPALVSSEAIEQVLVA